MCILVYMYECGCTRVCVCVYACVACVCGFMYECTGVFLCEFMCSVACCSDTDPFGEIQTRYRRFVLVLVMNPYTSDSMTDPWEDLEIRTGSCSGNQTVIRF